MTDILDTLHEFWSSFGIPAFISGYVPKGAKLPYITYTVNIAPFLASANNTVQLWFRTGNFDKCSLLAAKINSAIPPCGLILNLPHKKGALKLDRASPFFSTALPANSDGYFQSATFNLSLTSFVGGGNF